MIALGCQLEQAFMEQFVGREVTVLFEEEYAGKKGYLEGHTDHYIKVIAPGKPEMEGEVLPVFVEELEEGCLAGRVVCPEIRGHQGQKES